MLEKVVAGPGAVPQEKLGQFFDLVITLENQKKAFIPVAADPLEGPVEHRQKGLPPGPPLLDDFLQEQEQVVDGIGFYLRVLDGFDGFAKNLHKPSGRFRPLGMTLEQVKVVQGVGGALPGR